MRGVCNTLHAQSQRVCPPRTGAGTCSWGACDAGLVRAQDYQRLLASQPSRRLNPARLAESGALKTRLVDTIAFLESLAVKDSAEKDLFFKRLPSVIPGLPLPVAQRKVLRLPPSLLLRWRSRRVSFRHPMRRAFKWS